MPNKNIKARLKEVEKKKKKEKVLSPSPSGVRLPGDCLALYASVRPASRAAVAAIYGSFCSRLSFDVIDEDRGRSLASSILENLFIFLFLLSRKILTEFRRIERFLVTNRY